jgi:hypothetical protein
VSALQLLFAQHELLQLAGGSLWKVRNEAPEARHFVGGEMATAQRFQLRAIRLRTGLRLDESRDNLAPFGVGQAATFATAGWVNSTSSTRADRCSLRRG